MGYKLFMGIDVGVGGGIAIINEISEVIEVFKTPISPKDFILKLLEYSDEKLFCLSEKTHAMPQDGAVSARKFGYIVGVTHTALIAAGIPYDEVIPRTWMKSFGMKRKKNEGNTSWKGRLKIKSQMLFPNVKCTLWNADALLIAYYCKEKFKS